MRALGEIPVIRRPRERVLLEVYGLQGGHVRSGAFGVGSGYNVAIYSNALPAIAVAVRGNHNASIVFTDQAAGDGVGCGTYGTCTYVSRGIAVFDDGITTRINAPTNQAAGDGSIGTF